MRLTTQDALSLLWEHHLGFLPSGKSYLCNRKALCRSFGGRWWDEVTPAYFRKHRAARLQGMPPFRSPVRLGSVFHDHGLLHLLDSKLREWKRDRAYGCEDLDLPPIPPTTGIEKVKPPKRKVVATPEEFLKLCQNATDRLRRTMEGLIDLDCRESDLGRLRPSNYNPYTDQVEWVQSKTGKENCVPASSRVKAHFQEARDRGREFVYDLTNSRKEFEEARKAAKVRHLTKRDLRKTTYNASLRFSGSHHLAGMMAGHASTRTGMDHYELEFREDLKPIIRHLEETFKSR